MDCSPLGSSVHGDSPGKNTEVGSLPLLQGKFPNQEPNWALLHWKWILYQLSHLGSPISEWRFHYCVICVRLVTQHGWLSATLWTVARQAPLSMGFTRQEHWSGLPWPPPGDLPNPEVEPSFPALQAVSLSSVPPGKPSSIIGCFLKKPV